MSKIMTPNLWQLDLGANIGATTTFKVWAPYHLSLSLNVLGKGIYPMLHHEDGYFTFEDKNLEAGDRYFYMMENGLERPDPVSRCLPAGVHGPTEIIDINFEWEDTDWKGIELGEAIFYEVHIGVFTTKGTFDGVEEKLKYLKDLGINCIEIMPIAQFTGEWNWGYDGVSLYAPFLGYGGCQGLKKLVNACHREGIAVSLDVVYNHLGPEGNNLAEFGPYFSETYHTPWGKAFNYDGHYSDYVRDYVIKNALHWIVEYHIDILRLDAIHGIYDFSASPMILELISEVRRMREALGRKVYITAESARNDAKVLHTKEQGGWELCALWNDDFHHAAHVALTGEKTTYLQDFNGVPDLAKAIREGFVYDGQYSAFRKCRHGNSSAGIPLEKFIVFLQNHDQVGNRPFGERLSTLIERERYMIGAILLLMTPSIPLLFMGEEYAESNPFEYFIDYEDERLMSSIYEGRKREFHREDMPYPGRVSFENSRLSWELDQEIFQLYRDLIALRKQYPAKKGTQIQVYQSGDWLAWEYPSEQGDWIGVMCNLGKKVTLSLPFQYVSGNQVLLSIGSIENKERESVFSSLSALVIK